MQTTATAYRTDIDCQESDIEDEEEGVASSSTGSWKPQLHFVWNTILDSYFPSSGTSSAKSGQAQFQDFFRVVVDGGFRIGCTAQ